MLIYTLKYALKYALKYTVKYTLKYARAVIASCLCFLGVLDVMYRY